MATGDARFRLHNMTFLRGSNLQNLWQILAKPFRPSISFFFFFSVSSLLEWYFCNFLQLGFPFYCSNPLVTSKLNPIKIFQAFPPFSSRYGSILLNQKIDRSYHHNSRSTPPRCVSSISRWGEISSRQLDLELRLMIDTATAIDLLQFRNRLV